MAEASCVVRSIRPGNSESWRPPLEKVQCQLHPAEIDGVFLDSMQINYVAVGFDPNNIQTQKRSISVLGESGVGNIFLVARVSCFALQGSAPCVILKKTVANDRASFV